MDDLIEKLDEYNLICREGYIYLLLVKNKDNIILKDMWNHPLSSGTPEFLLSYVQENIDQIHKQNRLAEFVPHLQSLFEKTLLTKAGFLKFVGETL